MTSFHRALISCLVLALAIAAWLGRYEIYPVPRADGIGSAYVLDRWTGATSVRHWDRHVPTLPPEVDKTK